MMKGSGLLEETVMVIPGLEREVVVWQLTDSHLSEDDGRDDDGVREMAARRRSTFGKSAPSGGGGLDAIFMEQIRLCTESGADLAVFTGDMIDFPSPRNLELVREGFARLAMPFLYTLGNHDWSYIHLPSDDTVRERAYPLFGSWLDGVPGCRAAEAGGIVFLAVDNSNYQVTAEQADFVRRQTDRGRPCLLFMHIPVHVPSLEADVRHHWGAPIMMGATGWTEPELAKWGIRRPDESTAAFCSWLLSNRGGSERIRGVFCGHLHFSHADAIGGGRSQYVTAPGFAGCSRRIRLIGS